MFDASTELGSFLTALWKFTHDLGRGVQKHDNFSKFPPNFHIPTIACSSLCAYIPSPPCCNNDQTGSSLVVEHEKYCESTVVRRGLVRISPKRRQ